MKSVLVVGASSYVGARIYQELKNNSYEVSGTFNSNQLLPELIKLDLTNETEITSVLSAINPKIIILASALSSQATVAADPERASAVNVNGSKQLAEWARKIGATLIYLSTEAIFHGSDYGNSKLLSEEIIKNSGASFLILRLGMCFGLSPNRTNDRPFNRLLKAKLTGDPVSYDSALKFFPTEIGNLSRVIVQLVEKGHVNDTIDVVCMPETDRFEIATRVLSGIQVSEVRQEGVPGLPPMSSERAKSLGVEVLGKEEFLRQVGSDIQL
jgi:dTDP-4-dehydrorhamnose reductase